MDLCLCGALWVKNLDLEAGGDSGGGGGGGRSGHCR